jgi:D-3-phosphoglycerate dehydrogenase
MTEPTPTARVHVAPADSPWADAVSTAVEAGGGTVTDLEDAEAVVWLEKHAAGLHEVLHDRISWVQYRMAGIDALVAAGVIDDRRISTTARGIYADSVAEHAYALILGALSRIHDSIRRGSPGPPLAGRRLGDLTIAVIGAGGIGTALIRLLAPSGADIIAVTRSGRIVEGCMRSLPASRLDEVWPVADVVVLAAPSTAATSRLVDADVLAHLPRDAVLVNIARGSLVDTEAVVNALRQGRLGAAALDVTDPEPLPDGHPLWSEPRALITPHSANPGSAQIVRLCGLVTENVRRFIEDEPLRNTVDVEAGY